MNLQAKYASKHSAGFCPVHQKQLYPSRTLAKKVISDHNEPGMREYQCDAREGHWHVGHLPNAVRNGHSTADEHYGRPTPTEKPDMSLIYSTPEGADQPLTQRVNAPAITLNGHTKADNSIEWLLASAEASDIDEVATLARRIRALLVELVDLIRRGTKERDLLRLVEERQRALDEAMAQLAELRGSVPERDGGAVGAASPSGMEALSGQREIREWARSQGIDVPIRGSIPVAIRDQYFQAKVGAK